MNASSSPRTDGDDAVISDDRNAVDEIGERLGEMELGVTSNHASLSTMPDTVLLNIFSFVLSKDKLPYANGEVYEFFREHLKVQLALEKTCRRFSAFLGQDATMRLLYHNLKLNLEFSYQVETMREKLFISNGLRIVVEYQTSTGNQICKYMGGADGVRRVIDKILMTKMEQLWTTQPLHPHAPGRLGPMDIIQPPSFPENGFKLFLRGDSTYCISD